MGDTKEIIRARALRLRESLSASEIASKSRLIQQTVLSFPPYLKSRAVASYSPSGNEVGTADICDHALKAGKKLFYPRLGGGTDLHWVRLEASGKMAPGRYGILEPTGVVRLAKKDEEGLIVFVPGLAFDLHGNRLGRGKGWYDRALGTLGGLARFIALAFEFQIVDEIPTDSWDRKVHHIITERRVIDCGDLPSDSGWVS
ncbi:MAG: 5-formyltetrahydrofolate cyclo-ligase [Candidatus Binatia bacterium]